jgi:L-type amino acid transporter 6
MVFNALVASVYVLIGTFGALLTFAGRSSQTSSIVILTMSQGITEYLFFFFAVLGVFILRTRSHREEAIHRTWSLNPVIFCFVSGFLVVRGISTDPLQGLTLLVIILVGLLYRHFFLAYKRASPDEFDL